VRPSDGPYSPPVILGDSPSRCSPSALLVAADE
jgi:hypothetical protein